MGKCPKMHVNTSFLENVIILSLDRTAIANYYTKACKFMSVFLLYHFSNEYGCVGACVCACVRVCV